MQIELVEREPFTVCGSTTVTTLENNDADLSVLYDDFFRDGWDTSLAVVRPADEYGYYGVEWHTDESHKSYGYLLGVRAARGCSVPVGATTMDIPKATWAVARFPKGSDIIKAWTDFYVDCIPAAGLEIDEGCNRFFERYPDKVDGDFELWVPVMPSSSSIDC